MKSLLAGFLIVFALGLVALMTMSSSPKESKQMNQDLNQQNKQGASAQAPKPTKGSELVAGKSYTAIIHTGAGDMTVALNAQTTPITVNNFVTLARKGFYNKTIFHRVIKGFMIQGGDPQGDGTGGPGYTIEDELFEGEYTRGTIAMARTMAPNSAGSQFFIVHQDNMTLPKDYVIFGKLTAGLETLDAIANTPTTMNAQGTEESTPVEPVTITSIDILEE
ncbi:MAG: peptidylprolyl isomerase [Candidatus Roizmanbacteria bacterium]|nr:peptidylprolyl isomerase [Candidatus Roizmanbacteria bacterium]